MQKVRIGCIHKIDKDGHEHEKDGKVATTTY